MKQPKIVSINANGHFDDWPNPSGAITTMNVLMIGKLALHIAETESRNLAGAGNCRARGFESVNETFGVDGYFR